MPSFLKIKRTIKTLTRHDRIIRKPPVAAFAATGGFVACGRCCIYWQAEGGDLMKLDRRALDRLLSLNDAQLAAVIDKLTREYGVDLSGLNISTADMAALRRTLRATTDEELLHFTRKLRGGK